MQKLEYVTTGFGSSKYMSVDMLFENLIKNVVPPARFIIADYNMPEMMGSEMCTHIRNHFDALTSKLVHDESSLPEFEQLRSCVPPEQMQELLERFKPILIIVSAYTKDDALISDCQKCNIDYIQPKPLKPDEIREIIEKFKTKKE